MKIFFWGPCKFKFCLFAPYYRLCLTRLILTNSHCRSSHEIGRGYPGRGLYLELERGAAGDLSPPSDNVLFDNQCYATTPSSSNGNSDPEQASHYHGRQPRHGHHHQVTVILLKPTRL